MILYRAISMFLRVLIYLILGRAIASWFIRPGDRLYPLYMQLVRVTEPLLAPFRKMTERFGMRSGIDLSPLLAILAIYIIQRLLFSLMV